MGRRRGIRKTGRPLKPSRSPRNPVKITFLCEYGQRSSPVTAQAFMEFLKEKGLDKYVRPESGGVQFLMENKGNVEGRDFVVLLGKDLYSKFETPGAEKIVLERMTGKVSRKVFENLLKRIREKFELE